MENLAEKIDKLYAENKGEQAETLMLNALKQAEDSLECGSEGQ
jgi:hypothetical protein